MDITLSWDLFIIVFAVVIMAYSLIIGQDQTLKVILGTYVSAVAADAGGQLIGTYLGGSQLFMNLLKMVSVSNDDDATIIVKVSIFVVFVILFAVKGAFEVDVSDDRHGLVRLFVSVLYGIMSAGLIISSILIFVSGISFVGGGSALTVRSALSPIYNQSEIVKWMVQYTYFFFSIPALTFLFHSFHSAKE